MDKAFEDEKRGEGWRMDLKAEKVEGMTMVGVSAEAFPLRHGNCLCALKRIWTNIGRF